MGKKMLKLNSKFNDLAFICVFALVWLCVLVVLFLVVDFLNQHKILWGIALIAVFHYSFLVTGYLISLLPERWFGSD